MVRNANEDFLIIFPQSWPKQPLPNGVFSEREGGRPFPIAKEGDGLKLPWDQKESVRHMQADKEPMLYIEKGCDCGTE